MPNPEHDPVVGQIIGAAIKVHRALGPGLLESPYAFCLEHELRKSGLHVQREVPVPLVYDGIALDCGFRLDLVVDRDVIVEVKRVEALLPIHDAQVITYLRLTGARRALLLNFNAPTLIAGLHSFLGTGKQVPGSAAKVGAEGNDVP